ncbi:TIGR02147 family protein [Chitinispirillales bacterium ANBcel5]|uniref:TIGR02147 family protein n=1 Tax=Cellulosispirillum alkaliphilum TaxID=3039283 RepID=UPI002A525B1D|nr:TIGR02147 family protein [Chitinispirillales bacterium ANBcel5]
MKKLFEYFDYQKFMRDFYEEKKQQNPYVSFRYLGRRMDLDPGFLLKVLQGKHHLAKRSIPSVCAFFKFSELEAHYFDVLVSYNKAKTASDTKLYFEKLMSLRKPHVKPVEEFQYAFYQKWYHSAIHSLLSIYEFRGGFKKLASMLVPKITAKQAQDSIDLLTKIGMVYQDDDGVYRSTDMYVTSGDRWKSVAIHNFQKEAIKLSEQALDLHAKEVRDISTVTVALSMKDLPEIRERIDQFRNSIMSLDNEYQPDTVFQVNIQVLPVTVQLGDKE